jgi:hypothetical protein
MHGATGPQRLLKATTADRHGYGCRQVLPGYAGRVRGPNSRRIYVTSAQPRRCRSRGPLRQPSRDAARVREVTAQGLGATAIAKALGRASIGFWTRSGVLTGVGAVALAPCVVESIDVSPTTTPASISQWGAPRASAQRRSTAPAGPPTSGSRCAIPPVSPRRGSAARFGIDEVRAAPARLTCGYRGPLSDTQATSCCPAGREGVGPLEQRVDSRQPSLLT